MDSKPGTAPSTRRDLLKTCLGAAAVMFAPIMGKGSPGPRPGKGKIPLVHTTDLYHPPQDPDDQIDLATVAALDEFDLRGVVLDVSARFLESAPEGFDIRRDPGFIPVVQLGYLLGRSIPVAAGPTRALASPTDTARDLPDREQAGIRMLLEILDASPEPVVITVVGSARVITAAFNREPELMRRKTRAVVLNAGSTGGPKTEWNVGLDRHAFVGLWQSGLPVHWYPCGTEKSAFVRRHERGTYWKVSHEELFHDLPQSLRAWFAYGFSGSPRADFIRALDDMGNGAEWESVLEGERNMWSTASLVMAAGRILAKTPDGWRFVRPEAASGLDIWPWRLDPISATVSADGMVQWELDEASKSRFIFGRQPDVEYGQAMAEALNALLRGLPV